jgi:hypothetical protein
MWQSIEAILVNAVDKGYQRCKDHDLTQITRLLSFERTAQILGFSVSGFTKALACAHFEVTFDSEITSGTPSPLTTGDQGTYTFQGDWERALTRVPVDISGSATAPLPSTKFTFTSDTQGPCASGSGSYTIHDSAGAATPMNDTAIYLFLDLNPREDPPAGEPAPAPRKSFVLVDPRNVTESETYDSTETICSGAVTNTSYTNFTWYSLLEGFHANAGMLRFDLDMSTQLNDLLASQHIVNSRTNGGTTSNESTFVEVWHTPQ